MLCLSVAAHLFCRHQMLTSEPMIVLGCAACPFVTDKRCRYDDHVKMHLNIRDIACPQCGKLFVTKKMLRQHVQKVHRRNPSGSVVGCPSVEKQESVVAAVPTDVSAVGNKLAIIGNITRVDSMYGGGGGMPADAGVVGVLLESFHPVTTSQQAQAAAAAFQQCPTPTSFQVSDISTSFQQSSTPSFQASATALSYQQYPAPSSFLVSLASFQQSSTPVTF